MTKTTQNPPRPHPGLYRLDVQAPNPHYRPPPPVPTVQWKQWSDLEYFPRGLYRIAFEEDGSFGIRRCENAGILNSVRDDDTIASLLPYLTEVGREQLRTTKEAMEFAKAHSEPSPYNVFCPKRPVSPEEVLAQLVASGDVTPQQVAEAAAELHKTELPEAK